MDSLVVVIGSVAALVLVVLIIAAQLQLFAIRRSIERLVELEERRAVSPVRPVPPGERLDIPAPTFGASR